MREVAPVLVAAVLLAAAVLKLEEPRPLESTLRKLGPAPLWRRIGHPVGRGIARAVGLLELAVAAAIVSATGRAAPVAALVLASAFVVAVLVAVRRGASCGCFGALSSRPAGRLEMARAAGVWALALVALVVPSAHHPRWVVPVTVVAALVLRGVAASPLITRRPRESVPPPPVEPWPADPVAALRATPELVEAERILAEAGAAVDWSTCRATNAGGFLLVTAGVPGSVVLTARYHGPGQPVFGSAHLGELHVTFREGTVVGGRP